MKIRKAIATSAVAMACLSTPATAARPYGEIEAALRSYRDRQAIAELVTWYRRWLDGLRAQSETPFTGPECDGRWAIPTSIVWRESRCQQTARSPISTAGGAYQMLRASRDWALATAGLGRYVGTPAEHLPLWVQHRAAAALWDDSPCHWAPNAWC